MSKVNFITQAEYAKHRGCSAVAVHKAVTAGRISLINGLIDPVVADIQWAANTRARATRSVPAGQAAAPAENTDAIDQLPLADSPAAPTAPVLALSDPLAGQSDYTKWRGRREAADAEIAELKLQELRKDLINVAAVERVWSSVLTSAREHLLQVRSRLAPLLAAESDVFKIEQMLDEEHRRALELLASAEVRVSDR